VPLLKNRLGYAIFAMVLMIVGLAVLPVSAAFVPITEEMTEQSFDADSDGHTYLYVSSELDYLSKDYLVHMPTMMIGILIPLHLKVLQQGNILSKHGIMLREGGLMMELH